MKEFTKVSIHNHFGGDKSDKLINQPFDKIYDFDYKSAFEKIDEAKTYGYQLLAMTQANVFDVTSYVLLRVYAKRVGIVLLPGVEINIKNGSSKYLHVVVNFDVKNNLFAIQGMIEQYTKSNKENSLTLEQFLDLIVTFKCVIIPHGVKQTKRSSANNPEILTELISLSNSIPVVLEDSKSYHKEILKSRIKEVLCDRDYNWIEKSAVVSSADRHSFAEIESPTYIWGTASFDDLYYSCFMGKTRIKQESDLIQKINYISRIEFLDSDETQISPTSINCSHGLNTVIGPSGSGKTLLLDVIKRKLTGSGLDNKTISKKGDYTSVYNLENVSIYDRDNNLIDATSGYNIVEGEILYNKVISAYQSDRKTMLKELNIEMNYSEVQKIIDDFNEDINKYKDVSLKIKNNRNKVNQLLSNAASTILFLNENRHKIENVINYNKDEQLNTTITTNNSNLANMRSDITQIDLKFNELIILARKYGFEEQFKVDIDFGWKKMRNTILKKRLTLRNSTDKSKKTFLIQDKLFENVQEYNKTIGQQSALVVERNQELLKQFEEIHNLVFENAVLKLQLNVPVINQTKIRDAVQFMPGSFSKLTINKVKLVYNGDELKGYCPSNIGTTPKVNKSKFSKNSYNFELEDDVRLFVDTFIENEYEDRIVFLPKPTDLLDYNIELKNIEGNYEDINSISAGNLSKIYINRMFSEKIESSGSNVIILYDQPDSNMEKAFILGDLGPKLSDLRDKYQVFITTHEPLLVVNADSNNIIAASNDKTVVKVNDINYVNRSFAGANSRASLILEVAKLIDGHPEAISKRNTIYGGLLSENSN